MYYKENNNYVGRYSEDMCNNMNCYSTPYDCCKNNCCYNKCDDIIKKAHEMFKEANCIYDNMDKLLSDKIVHQIMDVICSMENYIICNKKADKLYEDGINLIKSNGCNKKCIKSECADYLAETSEYYGYKDRTIKSIKTLLNRALEDTQEAVKITEKENTAFDNYISCIHRNCSN